MKLNEKETWEYIKLQLPIVKGELQQANNKVNTLISVLGLFITLIFGMLIFFCTKIEQEHFYSIGIVFSFVLSSFLLYKLIIATKSLKPIFQIKENKKEKNIDIYNFLEISKISFEHFKSYFDLTNKQEKPLFQIHINSLITK